MEDPILFALAVITILGTPGPTNTLLATSGAAVGIRRSLPLVPAEAAGYLIAILTLGLLLGPVVAAAPWLAMALRVLVGAYLLLLAVKLWRSGRVALGARALVSPGQVFLTTLLNPKALILALGIIPFASPLAFRYVGGFLLLLVAISLAWVSLGAVLGGIAGSRGRAGLVPRFGAAAVGLFAALILALPFLR
jgi:threonine/homoserine/homoserine lactone efflux protein